MSAPRDEAEKERLKQVSRCASFSAVETVKGRQVNIMAGLELHKNVLNPKEQQRLLEFIWCALSFPKRCFIGASCAHSAAHAQRSALRAAAASARARTDAAGAEKRVVRVSFAGSSWRAAAATSCRGAPSPRRASG